jgi:hypothetical protein
MPARRRVHHPENGFSNLEDKVDEIEQNGIYIYTVQDQGNKLYLLTFLGMRGESMTISVGIDDRRNKFDLVPIFNTFSDDTLNFIKNIIRNSFTYYPMVRSNVPV